MFCLLNFRNAKIEGYGVIGLYCREDLELSLEEVGGYAHEWDGGDTIEESPFFFLTIVA